MKICTFENIASCHHFCCIFSQAVQSLRVQVSIICRNASTFVLCRKELRFPQCLEFWPCRCKALGGLWGPRGYLFCFYSLYGVKNWNCGFFHPPCQSFQGLGISFIRVRRTVRIKPQPHTRWQVVGSPIAYPYQ